MAHSQGFHLLCAWEAGAEHWEASGRTTQRENLGNARSHLQGGVWSQLQVLAPNSLRELPKWGLKSLKRQCQAQIHSLAWAQLSTAQIYPEAEGGNLSVTDASEELLMEWKRSREYSRASWICPPGSTSVISKLMGQPPGPHFHLALRAELIKDG